MENPAKQITVYPAKMVDGLWAALALVAGFWRRDDIGYVA